MNGKYGVRGGVEKMESPGRYKWKKWSFFVDMKRVAK